MTNFQTIRELASAAALALLYAIGPVPVAAAETCIEFPLGVGPEQVCADGNFPAEPIQLGPGDQLRLPLVTYTNDTDRDMTFTIEVIAPFVSTGFHSVTLAPGQQESYPNVLLLEVDDNFTIGTIETVVVGWSASGELSGEDDYLVTIERQIDVLVGPDSDGDGLVDGWETNGYDPDGDGVVDIDLPGMGADPMHKDLFLELDWEVGGAPFKASIDEVKEAFALAPVDSGGTPNPDGQPGIRLWVDTGGLVDASGDLVGDNLGGGNELPIGPWTFGGPRCMGGLDDGDDCSSDNPCDDVVPGDEAGRCVAGFYIGKAMHFNPIRANIFRYGIVSSTVPGGQGELGGNDIWLGSTRSISWLAYELMHELGHNLHLSHGGQPQENGKRNCEPNYISTMNYRHSRIRLLNGSTQVDFSPARFSNGGRAQAPLAELEEVSLDETTPLDPTDGEHVLNYTGPPQICSALCVGGPRNGGRCASDDECADADDPPASGVCGGIFQEGASCSIDTDCDGGRCGGLIRTTFGNQPIDWDEDGVLETSVAQSIDGTYAKGACGNEGFAAELTQLPDTSLTSHNDWSNISLPFLQFGKSANAALNPAFEAENREAEGLALLEELATTHLRVQKTGPAGPFEGASAVELAYSIDLENLGPHPAGAVVVRDDLPPGFAIVELDDRCSQDAPGIVECAVTGLLAGDLTSLAIRVEGVADCLDDLPVAIVNRVGVENRSEFAGPDPVPDDTHDAWTTQVADTTAPELTVSLSPAVLWPPNHKLVAVEASVEAEDACDASPSVRLVSITSNEPDDGTGDGATGGDVVGADLGTDDRSFELRSERSGGGSGRIYTVAYEAVDASGNVARASATVSVLHDRRAKP